MPSRQLRSSSAAAMLAALTWLGSGVPLPAAEVSVRPGPDGRLAYSTWGAGDRIPDFSVAGYRGGGEPLPDVPVRVTVEPGAAGGDADDTPRIQAAIREVEAFPEDAAGFRGAILLRRGRYRIGGRLEIAASGVVLRGEGRGAEGTVLVATGTSTRTLVVVGPVRKPAGGATQPPLRRSTVADDVVPVGATTLRVRDASAFAPGDSVRVIRAGNEAWIDAIGMDRIKPLRPGRKVEQWSPFRLEFDRVVRAVDGDAVTLDAPLTCAIEARFGGGEIRTFADARIVRCGVERLRGESEFDPAVTAEADGERYPADPAHATRLVQFDRVRDGWARDLEAVHFTHGAVACGGESRSITVRDCRATEMVSPLTGGWRYPFLVAGQLVLVHRCQARDARHAFALAARVCGPNVFLDCTSTREHGASEPHHRWSTGVLFDNCHGSILLVDRGGMGTGHGWAAANCVAWNCAGTLACEQPPTARNFAVGFVGTRKPGPFKRADGTWESEGRHVKPRSLYEAQLVERVGAEAAARALSR